MENEENESGIRITIDKELFNIILEQAVRMNEVCHGVLDVSFKKNNKLLREASKIIAKKFKGII